MHEQTYSVTDLISSKKLVVGDGYRAKNNELSEEGIPFARAGNIKDGFQFIGADKFPVADLKKCGQKISKAGDVVFTSKGTVGRFAFVSEDTETFVYSPQLCFWRSLDHLLISPRYLYYWMHSHEFLSQVNQVANKTDMAAYVSLTDQRQFRFSIPPLSDQKAIAHILGTLDDKIELNRKMNETLEEIAKAIFKSWFVDFDPVRAKMEGRPTGLPDDIAALFPDRLVDSEIGEIPEGWEVQKVKDEAIRERVGKLYSNKTAEEEGDVPVLDQSDDGIIGYHSNKEFVEASLDNPVFTFANHTCKMRLLFDNFSVIQNVIPMRSKSYPTIWFYLRTLDVKKFEEYKGHIPDLMDALLTFPPAELAMEMENYVRPLFHRGRLCLQENGLLTDLRDTLLPKLISGELQVPDAEKFLEEAGI